MTGRELIKELLDRDLDSEVMFRIPDGQRDGFDLEVGGIHVDEEAPQLVVLTIG